MSQTPAAPAHAGVTITRGEHVLDIALDSPAKGNLLSAAMGAAIIEALSTIGDDVKLVRLSAVGPDFCLGRESPMPGKDAPKPNAETIRRVVTAPPVALYDAMKAAPVPLIGIVRGRAVGVGCALAGVCDILYCDSEARFSIPEMERDLPPTLVMSALVGRVPLKTIAHLVLSRDEIDAATALASGLVSAVHPGATLDAEVQRLSNTLLGNSAVTLRAVKQFLRLAPEMPQLAASTFATHLGATAISARF